MLTSATIILPPLHHYLAVRNTNTGAEHSYAVMYLSLLVVPCCTCKGAKYEMLRRKISFDLKKKKKKLFMVENSFLLKSLPIKDLVKRKCISVIFTFGYCFQPLFYEPQSLLMVHVHPRLLS